ncbi:DNA repair protein RAD50 [Pancytospora philotis]|nr:DNA repair protein RAD50 [Pancytospora philotis]
MSKLLKLSIRGIRSFSPKEANVLEFNTPLTLIVGANGTGKTTIIETLKYATCGSFPPNTKGGAFLYDPAMANEVDTQAEIKLRFRNNAKERMVCTRMLQVSQRGGRPVQKTLETSLSKEFYDGDENAPDRTGKENGFNYAGSQAGRARCELLSSKLAEVDKEVAEHLGVTPALLDSVIFCHQEESTWPISEPRILKERLDQIFCSEKYNKALKALKDTRKTVASDTKLKEQTLEFLFKEKSRRELIQAEAQRAADAVATKEQLLARLGDQRKRVEGELGTVGEEIAVYQKIEENFKAIKFEFDNCKNFIKNFSLEVLTDDGLAVELERLRSAGIEDAEDGDLLTRYQQAVQHVLSQLEASTNKADLEHAERECSRIEQAAQRYFEQLRRAKDAVARSKALETKTAEKRKERDAANEFLSKQFGCAGPEVAEKSSSVFRKAEADLRERQDAARGLRESLVLGKRRQSEIERELGTSYANCAEPDYTIDVERAVTIDYTARSRLEAEARECSGHCAARQSALNHAYKNTELSFKRTQLEDKIKRLADELASIDVEGLGRDVAALDDRRGLAEAEIRSAREAVQREQTRDSELQKKMRDCIDELKLLEQTERCGRIDSCARLSALLATAQQACSTIAIPGNSAPAVKKLVEHLVRSEFSGAAGILCIDNGTLLEEGIKPVDELQSEIEKCKTVASVTTNASAIYRNFIDVAKNKSECPLCKNGLSAPALLQLTSRLERVVLKLPEELLGSRERQTNLENALKAAEAGNEEAGRINSRRQRIRELSSTAEELFIKRIVDNVTAFYRLASVFEGMGEGEACGLGDFFAGSASLPLYTRKEAEIVALHKERFAKEALIEKAGSIRKEIDGLRRVVAGMPQDSADLSAITAELESAKKQLDSKEAELADMNESIRKLEVLRSAIAEEKARRAAAAAKKALESELAGLCDLKATEERLRADEERLESDNSAFLKSKLQAEMKIRALQSTESELLVIEKELQRRRAEVAAAGPVNSDDLLKHAFGDNYTRETVEQGLCEHRERLMQQKNRYIEDIRAADAYRGRISVAAENIKLRSAKERLLKIKGEFEGFDFGRLSQLKSKAASHEEKRNKLANAEAQTRGELKQMAASLNAMRQDLEQNYADTPTNYAKCVLGLRALEMSSADLDRCILALDKAIADFHQCKMDEVNATLRDLWASTYKGNDIEYIELQSDGADLKANTYTVVMVKNGAKMEMRGRCSAGQKMIASILIRLAMTDSFSSSCRILALDEPTTNLDRANIESFAATITRLIRERADTQLIVISHDEEFVELLNREGIDYFYRLRRDSRGNSHIEKHSVYNR